MTEPVEPSESSGHVEGEAPLGSWARLYALVLIAAVLVMLMLYWFTTAWNIPLEAR